MTVTTVWSTGVLGNQSPDTNITLRNVIPTALLAAASNATHFRITVQQGTSGFSGHIGPFYFGRQAAAGDAWDFNGNQVQVLFNGASAPASSASAQSASDWMAFTGGELWDNTQDYILSFSQDATSGNFGTYGTGITSFQAYWRGVGNDAATTDTTSYNASGAGNCFCLTKIEVTDAPPPPSKFGSKGTIGATGTTTANQSNIVLTTATTNVAIGDLVVVVVAVDNTSTTDQDASEISGVTSSPANTWTKAREWTNGQGTAQTGATVSMWYTVATAAMNTGSTITAAFTTSTSADAQAIIGWAFTKPAGAVSIEATNILATDGADPAALDATTRDIECLRIRAIGSEGAGSGSAPSLTPTTDWTAWGNGNSAATMSASEMYARAEHIVSTGTGASSNPTSWAADNASVYVAFAPPASLLFLPAAAIMPLIVR